MGIIWTHERIERYRRSSEYTAFHKKLSVLAEPYLDDTWTLADIGCGSGLLTLWLAPMVAYIDAIDINEAAIASLTARLDDVFDTSADVADKVKPRISDLRDLQGAWDVVLLSFFGVNEEVFETALPLAKKRVMIFMHSRREASEPFSPEDDGTKFTAPEMEAFLKERGFVYKKTVMEMQFGHPFKTIDEIHSFIGEYSDAKWIANAEERVVKTNRFDYPYYLPRSVGVAMFIIAVNKGER